MAYQSEIEKLEQRRLELVPGVEALRDAVQLSRARYDNGLSTYLEVLVADQQLFQQELQVALHAYVGGNYKLTAAWFHPMNGEKGPAAASNHSQMRCISAGGKKWQCTSPGRRKAKVPAA